MGFERILYVKENQFVFKDTKFQYESCVFVHFRNYHSVCNTSIFESDTEIKNVVKSYYVTPHIEFTTDLYAAPEEWLIENGFNRYINLKDEKKNVKKKKENVKS